MERKNISTNTKDKNFIVSGLTVNTGAKIFRFMVNQTTKTMEYNGKIFPYNDNPLIEAYKIIENETKQTK